MVHCIRSAIFIAALFAAPAQGDDVASGSVNIEGQSFEVVDAIAFHRFGNLSVSFADSPYDKEAMRADGKVDIFDRMGHDGLILAIDVAEESPSSCFHYAFDLEDTSTSGSVCEPGIAESVSISTHTDERVAGSVDWEGDDGGMVKVEFDVPIEPSGD